MVHLIIICYLGAFGRSSIDSRYSNDRVARKDWEFITMGCLLRDFDNLAGLADEQKIKLD